MDEAKTWRHFNYDGKPLISSIRVQTLGGHTHIDVWNRGGKAGTLVVNAEDGDRVAELLLPMKERG